MKRLTYKKIPEKHWIACINGDTYRSKIKYGYPSVQTLYNRLVEIENILGEEYDLIELAKLVNANREGRLVQLPVKIGDTVYVIRHELYPDDEYRMNFHKELSIVKQKFDLIHANLIGKTVFLTPQEAKAKLKEMQKDE